MPTKTAGPKEAPDPVAPETGPKPEKTDWEEEAAKEKPGTGGLPEDAPYEDPTAVPYETPEPPQDPVEAMEARLEAALGRRMEVMQRNIELLTLKAVEQALPQAVQLATHAAAMAAANKPPLTLRAGVADTFISSGGSKSPHLGHYRCERLKASKLQEFDMAQWRALQSGEVEWPKDKQGRKVKIQSLCAIQGSYIPFLDGHCYPLTQNQVDCLMVYKNELSAAEGGLPDLYEDKSTEPFRCRTCQGSTEVWTTREGYAQHMLHVHKVVEQAA